MDGNHRVLVVGGGLSGLATATFLAHYGAPCLLIERRTTTPRTSRNERLSARAMELLDGLGLREAVSETGFHPDALGDMLRTDTLAGEELGRTSQPWVPVPPEISPFQPVCCNHTWLRDLLRQRAVECGVEIWLGAELTRLWQDTEGIVATVRRAGELIEARAAYVVGADGPHSTVRGRAGIETEGPGTIAHQYGVRFRADLSGAIRGRHFAGAHLDRVGGILLAETEPDMWSLIRPVAPGHGPDLAELIRTAAGLPELEVTVEDTFTLPITLLNADRYTQDNVALIGDAACSMPPTPGMHASTVLPDAQNLAWKLALILAGAAGPALLGTYDTERRPLGQIALTDAIARVGMISPAEDLPDRITQEFGAVYRSTAVMPAEEAPGDFAHPLVSAGLPGTRAPHLETRAGSILDLFGRTFVCLTDSDSQRWASAAEEAAARLGVPLTAPRLDTDLPQAARSWAKAYGVTTGGAALIRPDGVVAWRAPAMGSSPEREIEHVLRRILSRGDQS
ncbi:FAD-dependent monooxygenase [Nonomuraea longispora]|nr:FAD-dependent monooxygenase [Nonomuraea longispora]